MDTTSYGLIEMVLVFGIILGLAIYELISVRRQLGRDDDAAQRQSDERRDADQG